MVSVPVTFALDVQIQQEKGILSIDYVLANGASARAGVCKGDVVLAICGEVMSSITEV